MQEEDKERQQIKEQVKKLEQTVQRLRARKKKEDKIINKWKNLIAYQNILRRGNFTTLPLAQKLGICFERKNDSLEGKKSLKIGTVICE